MTVTALHRGPTGEVTMSSIAISSIVFVCVFGGALFGMVLCPVLRKNSMDDIWMT